MTNWTLKDEEFKRILYRNNDPEHEAESVANTKKELVPHIHNTPCWRLLDKSVIQRLESATTFHTINIAINQMYDFADDNKIWLGFMPMD
jgi:hypothetical protein